MSQASSTTPLPQPHGLLFRSMAGITTGIAYVIARHPAAAVQLDLTTLIQHLFEQLPSPLDAGFHSGQRETHSLRRRVLCETFQFDQPNGVSIVIRQPVEHRTQTSGQLCSKPIGLVSGW